MIFFIKQKHPQIDLPHPKIMRKPKNFQLDKTKIHHQSSPGEGIDRSQPYQAVI